MLGFFSLMINDIKPASNLILAEDSNIAEPEVNSVMKWAENNQMTLNLSR